MKRHTTLTQLRIAQRQRFAGIAKDRLAVHTMMAGDGKEDFTEMTGGGITTRELRRRGHSFGRLQGQDTNSGMRGARRRPRVKTPLLPINKQTRKLQGSITLDGPSGANHQFELYANVRDGRQHVLRPGGTSKMVGRGLLGPTGLLRKRHKARRAAYVDVLRARTRARY